MNRHLLAILPAAALACGCATRSAGPNTAGPSAAGPSTAAAPPVAEVAEPPGQPGDPIVTLLEAGAEPRAPLRYRLRAGEKVVMMVDMEIAMRTSMEGRALPTNKVPPMRMTMTIDVVEVAPDGTTSNRAILTAVDVLAGPDDRPQVVAAMKHGMAVMVGFITDMKLTSRGFARDVKISMPAGLSPDMQSTLQNLRNATEQAAAIFPLEPVGQGARWRVESALDTGPLKLGQTAVVRLDRREANRALMSMTIEQTAPRQPITVAGRTTATLERYSGKGEGRVNAALDSRALEGRVTLKANMAMSVVAAGRPADAGVDVDMQMTFTPASAR